MSQGVLDIVLDKNLTESKNLRKSKKGKKKFNLTTFLTVPVMRTYSRQRRL